MKLSPKTFRLLFNLYPPFFFSRTHIKHVTPDWKHITVVLKKSLLNRNYVGTIFGGSLYTASDPFYMFMLLKILGIKNYVVWDQAAEITFLKPARTHITFEFQLSDAQIAEIHQALEKEPVFRPTYWVEGKDPNGEVIVKVRKILYIRKKDSP